MTLCSLKTIAASAVSMRSRRSTRDIGGYLAVSMTFRSVRGKPLGINNGVANAVVGGWQLSTNMTIQSGVPQSLNIGGVDNAGTGNQGPDRPNFTGAGSGYASNPTRARWYDPAAFTRGTRRNVRQCRDEIL